MGEHGVALIVVQHEDKVLKHLFTALKNSQTILLEAVSC